MLIVLIGAGVIAAIVSISVGEGGPLGADVGGVNDVQRIFGGIPQDGAILGTDDAETTVTVFNDLQCASTCVDFELETIDPLIERYARGEDVRFEFRHFSLAPNDTTLAAIAAEAAGRQSRQWQYIDTFFRNQDLVASRGVVDETMREIAEAVPQLELEQWQDDYDSGEAEELVRADAMLASELELTAEPAVVISGPAGQRELTDTPSLERSKRRSRGVRGSSARPKARAQDAHPDDAPVLLGVVDHLLDEEIAVCVVAAKPVGNPLAVGHLGGLDLDQLVEVVRLLEPTLEQQRRDIACA